MTTSSPGWKNMRRVEMIDRSCRFSRFRLTAPLSPWRVRNPMRVARCWLVSAPTDSDTLCAHRPRRYTARNALVSFSDVMARV